jgi:hypothetical protein
MIPRPVPRILLFGAALAFLGGCGSNDPKAPPDGGGPVARDEFQLEFTGLGDPTPGHYEAWFIADGETLSGGKFRVSSSGDILDLAGKTLANGVLRAPAGLDVTRSTQAFISLESDNDADPAPSKTRLLGGDFSGTSADLTVADSLALGIPLGSSTGQYVLDTPTTESRLDFNRGAAWITPGPDTLSPPTASLNLDTLPSGWSYEGWVMRPTGSGFIGYSTGRFRDGEGFDSDRAGQTAGPFGPDSDGDGRGDGYGFPGQDFVDSSGNVPPLVLDAGGLRLAVSVEPEPDNAASPFFITVLDAEIPAGTSQVTPTLTGLGPQGQGHFEAWARFPSGATTSIGKFRVDGGGVIRDLSGNPIGAFTVPGDLFLTQRMFVTVEAEGDANSTPSGSKVLEGLFSDSLLVSMLSSDSVLANGDVLTNPTFAAAYFLNTFTTADPADFGLGIWFYDPSKGPLDPDVPSLTLPILKAGWVFEGWVVRRSTGDAYSTGRFLSGSDTDSDRAGVTAGTFGPDLDGDGLADGPRFPGQDFVNAAGGVPAPLDLDSGDFRVLITIEPNPDSDPGPFILTLFEDDLVDSLGALITQPAPPATTFPAGSLSVARGPVLRSMTNVASSLPTGRVTVAGN